MKSMMRLFLLLFVAGAALQSCKKDENKISLEGATPPTLTASRTGSIPLSFATQSAEAIKFNWTNPDYKFTTGISSQDVTYTLEMDTVGANFTNPNKKSVSVSKDLEVVFTQSQINDYLTNQLRLDTNVTHQLEVRVVASLGKNSAAPMSSTSLKFAVIPYAIPPKVTPPASGTLYITGSATPASWMSGGDPPNAAQKFTKISNTVYELPSIALSGGNSFLFVPVYGDWSAKYGGIGANNTNNVDGDEFKLNGGDLKAPAASGNFKIQVDFQRGKYTVTKL